MSTAAASPAASAAAPAGGGRFSLAANATALLAVGMMVVILMMVLPVPAIVLDLGLTMSFALAVLIFTVTLFVERPLDFSAFPTILLGSLLLRLSLNVSSTKLIIGQGHTGPDAAGSVIEGFAMFVMGGDFFLGIVVFCVLLIVNFMVITKGAGRMAEVGARFALDAMPGKQLAIDSDLAAGAITHEEAKERRRIEQEETTFFGSLDGASKFVKGDAVAGLLITLLNLIAGLAIGVSAHGLSVGDALASYSILTVGDGLVSQIPAVIISVATAMLLSKGRAAGATDVAVVGQLGRNPAAVATVGGILAAFAFLPGLPFLPFIIGSGACFAIAQAIRQARAAEAAKPPPEKPDAEKKKAKELGDVLDVDEIRLEFAEDLVPVAIDEVLGLNARITKIRRYLAEEFGFVTPPVRLTDNLDYERGVYTIKVQGVPTARGVLRTGAALVIADNLSELPFEGDDVEEPVYGAPARWIAPELRDEALALGCAVVEPAEIIATHLVETIKQNFANLLSRRSMRRILDEFVNVSDPEKATANKRLLDEFVPDKAPVEFLQAVLKILLDEMIPIRNLPLILEATADGRALYAQAEEVAEHVRQKIAPGFVAKLLSEDGVLTLVQIGPEWEDLFAEHETTGPQGGVDIALPPEAFNRLAEAVRTRLEEARARGQSPAVVTTAKRRRFIRTVLYAKRIEAPVLAYEEIDPRQKLLLVGKA